MNKRYVFLPDSNKCSALRQHSACTNGNWRLFKHRSCLWLGPAWVSDTLTPPCASQSEAATSPSHLYPSLDDAVRCRLVKQKPGGSSLMCVDVGNIDRLTWVWIARLLNRDCLAPCRVWLWTHLGIFTSSHHQWKINGDPPKNFYPSISTGHRHEKAHLHTHQPIQRSHKIIR